MDGTLLTKPKPRTVASWALVEQMREGKLYLDAPYQRDVVWDQNKMSKLVDSIFYNYYIQPLVFAVRKVGGKPVRMVIDGKQRLTALRMFMENRIPFYDRESLEPIYYSKEVEQGVDRGDNVKYLDQRQLNTFNSHQFVCVEYSNISEDDEFDVFSRIQLGVEITTAQKLNAHNTPVATLCRVLSKQYIDIQAFLNRKGDAQVFQLIAQILLTLKNGKDDFKGSPQRLREFVSDVRYIPAIPLVNSLKKVLDVLKALSINISLSDVFMKEPFSTSVKALEIISFSVYIALVQRQRTVDAYARDFASLREYIIQKLEGKMYLGKRNYLAVMEWVDDYLKRKDLITSKPQVHPVYDTSSDEDDDSADELKTDEYDHEPAVYNSPQLKRRRTVAVNRRNSHHQELSIAKRGGKR